MSSSTAVSLCKHYLVDIKTLLKMVTVVGSAYALLVLGLNNIVWCIHHVALDEEDKKLISGIFE